MNMKKLIVFIIVFAIIASALTGCGKSAQVTQYNKDKEATSISTQLVASNNNYSLKWDDEGKVVMLESLQTGKVWANIPYEYYIDGGMSANVNSTINITVADNTTLQWQTVRGYDGAFSGGRIFCKKIENGLSITYCFDNFEIAIPVNYILRDDSLQVTVDTSKITESRKEFTLISVTLAPFMCSAQNANPGSYLFVPTGTGALMYTTEKIEGARKYSGEVYGSDLSYTVEDPYSYEEPIRLPVFGVKDGNDALLGIIEDGAPSAVIEAEAGNSRNGYSTIYSTFYYRGFDKYRSGVYAMGVGEITQFSEVVNQSDFSIGFYPLSNSDADYNGMAKRYRQYLKDSDQYVESDINKSPYSITLLGGTVITSTFMGVPKKKMTAMTTFSEAEQIIDDLYNETSLKPAVRLMGFGNNGILPGEIAGGYELLSNFGGKSQYSKLETYCDTNTIPLFMDYDVIKFNESGNGFSYQGNSAKNAMMKIATLSETTPIRRNDSPIKFRLLSRNKLSTAVDKVIKQSKKSNVSGLSFSTLGSVAYSDYDNNLYAIKNEIDSDVNKIIKKVKELGYKTAVANANSYAASVADVVFDVSLTNGSYNAFDEYIPFYQMVFQNDKSMYSTSINSASNPEKEIMLAITSGVGLNFSLINEFDVNYTEYTNDSIYTMLYSDNKPFIINELQKYMDVYEKIKGADIERYEIVEKGITKTVFTNGVEIYANHRNETVQSTIGTLEPYQIVIG